MKRLAIIKQLPSVVSKKNCLLDLALDHKYLCFQMLEISLSNTDQIRHISVAALIVTPLS